jgi:hypothetical protein
MSTETMSIELIYNELKHYDFRTRTRILNWLRERSADDYEKEIAEINRYREPSESGEKMKLTK